MATISMGAKHEIILLSSTIFHSDHIINIQLNEWAEKLATQFFRVAPPLKLSQFVLYINNLNYITD